MQLLLLRPGEDPVTILSMEGVTQGDPLSMVLYELTLLPPEEEICAAAPNMLAPFYTDDSTFNALVERSASIMTLILDRGTEREYFTGPEKSLFICD